MSSRRPLVHRRRGDPRFVKLWLGDWRKVVVTNAAAAGDRAELIVVTAPGEDGGLTWDKSKCHHPPGVKCSGTRGCQVELTLAVEWNKSAPARWSQLHEAAANRVRRRLTKLTGCGSFRVIVRAWEPQRRGVLHQNVLVPTNTPRQHHAAKLYREALSELAPRYGFGFVSQRAAVKGALHGARYMAKYIAKSDTPGKLGIGDVAAREDAPGRIAFVDTRLTTQTGETIRACRERRTVWRLASVLAAVRPDVGCSLEEAAEIRETHRVGQLLAEIEARARRARVMGDGWNDELERRRAEADHQARWLHRELALLGMAPELVAG